MGALKVLLKLFIVTFVISVIIIFAGIFIAMPSGDAEVAFTMLIPFTVILSILVQKFLGGWIFR